MWATVGAALKKIAVALLGNPKVLKTIGGIVLGLRLLHHISRMIQNRLEDERRGKGGTIIERKLRRQIEEKKQALGIRL